MTASVCEPNRKERKDTIRLIIRKLIIFCFDVFVCLFCCHASLCFFLFWFLFWKKEIMNKYTYMKNNNNNNYKHFDLFPPSQCVWLFVVWFCCIFFNKLVSFSLQNDVANTTFKQKRSRISFGLTYRLIFTANNYLLINKTTKNEITLFIGINPSGYNNLLVLFFVNDHVYFLIFWKSSHRQQ